MKKKAVRAEQEKSAINSFVSSNNMGVKLPNIIIKKFNGDPIAWRFFGKIFAATLAKIRI